MKLAIILNGNIRTWEQTKQSFKDVLGTLNPDVYLSSYDLQFGYHPYIKNVINDSSDVILQEGEIRYLFSDINLKNMMIEGSTVTKYLESEQNNLHPSMRGTLSSYAQYRKYKLGMNVVKAFELYEKFQYTHILKTRCDLIYNKVDFETIINLQERTIGVDKGNVFPNDCIFFGKRDNMVKMAEFMYDEFYKPVYVNSNEQAPHGLLRNAINHINCGVLSYPLINHVLRKDGKVQYY